MEPYAEETLKIARERIAGLESRILEEVNRLLKSGAVDQASHNRGLLLGVAIENISDKWLRGDRTKKEYKNLKLF